jgi:hypothetical protein
MMKVSIYHFTIIVFIINVLGILLLSTQSVYSNSSKGMAALYVNAALTLIWLFFIVFRWLDRKYCQQIPAIQRIQRVVVVICYIGMWISMLAAYISYYTDCMTAFCNSTEDAFIAILSTGIFYLISHLYIAIYGLIVYWNALAPISGIYSPINTSR